VHRVEKFLLRVIGEDIEFRVQLAEQDLVVMADSGQMEQVLMNLAVNARDAMPDGGILTLRTERVESGSETALPSLAPGGYAVLSVSDTGEGMDQATRQRIFEPFFTTKEVGKGTGLGLSMVYSIVKQHNGEISVSSEPGEGSTFKIYLRLAGSEAEAADSVRLAPPVGGSETILLADDDAEVRKAVVRILREYGYSVIEAVDGEEAVERFAGSKDSIDLVILDVVLPKRDGKAAADEIRSMRRGVPVLFVSGYTPDIIASKGIEEGAQLMYKPIVPHLLLPKLRELLSR
jgi:polar amino acid transport system substrate-binding protein